MGKYALRSKKYYPRRGPELSEWDRSRIQAFHDAGLTISEVEAKTDFKASTIRKTLRLNQSRQDGKTNRRTGRPRKDCERGMEIIVDFARNHPKYTYAMIQRELHPHIGRNTIRRILNEAGIQTWRAKKRPVLSKEVAQIRLQWAESRKNWTEKDWDHVLFSDECSVQRGAGGGAVWVFCRPEERLHPDLIEPTKKQDISVMIWASIRAGKKGPLIFMERDPKSKANGYSSNSYLAVLRQAFSGFHDPNILFMQDNAPIHTADQVIDWFKKRGIKLSPHPPYSPDLNPIEHVWSLMKRYIMTHHPELLLGGKGEWDYQCLREAIQEAWDSISEEVILNLSRSMVSRVSAVISAKGWHTKY